MPFQVYEKPCKNCLFTGDRVISPKRAGEMIKSCLENDQFFVCHCSSMQGGDVCCRKFFDTQGDKISVIRMAKGFEMVDFIPLPKSEKLPTYKQMDEKLKNRR